MSKKSNIYAITLIFAMMAALAIVENVRGVFIPLFKADFNISDTSIGLMLFISSLGYIAFTFLGGLWCEKLGQKKIFTMGFILIFISLIMLSVSYRFPVLLAAMFVMNAGLALTAIAVNTIVPVLFLSFQALLMNLTHFCYGLGSTFAQRAAGRLVFNGISWRSIYLAEAIIIALLAVLFSFMRLPITHRGGTEIHNENKQKTSYKLMFFFITALGFYVFAEVGTANWFVNFMRETYHLNESASSYYLAAFFGIFTVGRFVGGFVVEKTGYLNTVLISLVIAFAIYFIGLLIGERGLIVISVSGFFFAIAFPTIVLSIRKVFTHNVSAATGIILTGSSCINMIMNFVIGRLNDVYGAASSYYILPASLIISIISIGIIYRSTKECFAR